MTTTDEQKSEARAFLRYFATSLPDRAAVDECISHMKGGGECSKDYVCDLFHTIAVLEEELTAWHEASADGDFDRCRSRKLLAAAAKIFNTPTPELAEQEIETKLEAYLSVFLHEADPETDDYAACLVEAAFFLRDDLMAWGRNDLNGWEKKGGHSYAGD